MAKVIIRLKSGFELPITCDEFKLKITSGEISSYDIKGIKDNKPLFFRMEDVECIYQRWSRMDDCMDKRTAINLLDNLIGMVDDSQENDYDTALKMGIEALKAQRWIPCSEKMPSEEGQYLVTLKSYGYGSEYQVVDIASFENGEWFKWENYEWFQCCDVIAWMMPLPEPYKDGEQE